MANEIKSSDVRHKEEFAIHGKDYECGGQAAMAIQNRLRELGIPEAVVRRVAIACFEAEINVVLYASSGSMRLTVTKDRIMIEVEDIGPGIASVETAMVEGFTTSTDEIHALGFGAGMGLPNIKKNADSMTVMSEPGLGTVLWFDFVYEAKGGGQ